MPFFNDNALGLKHLFQFDKVSRRELLGETQFHQRDVVLVPLQKAADLHCETERAEQAGSTIMGALRASQTSTLATTSRISPGSTLKA